MRVIFSNGIAKVTDDEKVLDRTNEDYQSAELSGYNTAAPSLESLAKLYDKALYSTASLKEQQRAANEYKRYKELFLAMRNR